MSARSSGFQSGSCQPVGGERADRGRVETVRQDEPRRRAGPVRPLGVHFHSPAVTSFGRHGSRPAQKGIDHPTAADVRALTPAVGQDVRIVAPGFLQGVGQAGHPVEGTGGVDDLSQPERRGGVPGKEAGREWRRWAKGTTGSGPKEVGSTPGFRSPARLSAPIRSAGVVASARPRRGGDHRHCGRCRRRVSSAVGRWNPDAPGRSRGLGHPHSPVGRRVTRFLRAQHSPAQSVVTALRETCSKWRDYCLHPVVPVVIFPPEFNSPTPVAPQSPGGPTPRRRPPPRALLTPFRGAEATRAPRTSA